MREHLRMNGLLDEAAASELWNSARRTAKEALRPGTMLGYGRDTWPQGKHKTVGEPKAYTAQRLVDASRSTCTLAECERMTIVQLAERLQELGLPGRLTLKQSTEASNAGQSWEELKAAKVASDEKAAKFRSSNRR